VCVCICRRDGHKMRQSAYTCVNSCPPCPQVPHYVWEPADKLAKGVWNVRASLYAYVFACVCVSVCVGVSVNACLLVCVFVCFFVCLCVIVKHAEEMGAE